MREGHAHLTLGLTLGAQETDRADQHMVLGVPWSPRHASNKVTFYSIKMVHSRQVAIRQFNVDIVLLGVVMVVVAMQLVLLIAGYEFHVNRRL